MNKILKPFLIGGLVLLAGCGFRPIYGSESRETSVMTQLGQVSIGSIPDRGGQKLRNQLIDRMYAKGRPLQPSMVLDVVLHQSEESLGLQRDATTLRQQYTLAVDYTLKDNGGAILTKGFVRSVVSYNKLSAQYGTLVAKQNAEDRATQEVGEQLVNRLSLYLAEPLPAARDDKKEGDGVSVQ